MNPVKVPQNHMARCARMKPKKVQQNSWHTSSFSAALGLKVCFRCPSMKLSYFGVNLRAFGINWQMGFAGVCVLTWWSGYGTPLPSSQASDRHRLRVLSPLLEYMRIQVWRVCTQVLRRIASYIRTAGLPPQRPGRPVDDRGP